MSIRICKDRCAGCGACTKVCPGRLLKIGGNGLAEIPEPRDCWGCTACVKECRFGALEYYLGADIGGLGTTLQVNRETEQIHWIFTKPDGNQQTITTNRKDANSY